MSKKRSGTIALLTDFGWHNWYLGVMRGVILSLNPAVEIVDLCHDVSSQDVREGSFILGNSYPYFPKGTIFLAVVDPGVGGKRKNLVAVADDYYFVAPDNGILSCLLEKGIVRKVYHVSPGKYTLEVKGSTFYGRDIFAPIAAHLSLGVAPEKMGKETSAVLSVPAMRPVVNRSGEISGKAVYVDTFGNIITNIDEAFVKETFGSGLDWNHVKVKLSGKTIKGVKRYYQQGERGKLIALINSWGYLEIAVNRGSAFEKLGLEDKRSINIMLSL